MPLVNIELLAGRTDQDLRLIGDAVHEAKVELRPEDLAVILVENERTDWSFGRGQAS